MEKKIRVAVLCGGVSAEHEISLISAAKVLKHLSLDLYDPSLIIISRPGSFHKVPIENLLARELDPRNMEGLYPEIEAIPRKGIDVFFDPTDGTKLAFDVVFPIIHGTLGEDGAVQGFLKILDIPFVGADVLGSAIGMDKEISKRLLLAHGIPVAEFFCYKKGDKIDLDAIASKFGFPMFVKPASLGSSIGVTKVCSKDNLIEALDYAFNFDTKILIEKGVQGREIEFACVEEGNELKVTMACEIIPTCSFHSYESKYFAEKSAQMVIPAPLAENQIIEMKKLCKKVFRALCCEGMARIDCFLDREGKLIINEINTIPGMTPLSPFPLLCQASNWSFYEVINTLIQNALMRKSEQKGLLTLPDEIGKEEVVS